MTRGHFILTMAIGFCGGAGWNAPSPSEFLGWVVAYAVFSVLLLLWSGHVERCSQNA